MTGLDVLVPSSPEEAVAAFGDGDGVTVIAGGTIVLPEITYGRLRPRTRDPATRRRASRASARDGARVTIGATTPVVELAELPAPIGPCAANVADPEIRAQATVGGNLCAGAGPDAPRGDLQGALLALGATVRSAGRGRRGDGAARGLPRRPRRPARARRLVRRARGRRVRRARPAAHPRLHRPRGLRRARGRRHHPARRHRRRRARRTAPVGRGEGGRPAGGGRGGRGGRDASQTTRSPRPGTAGRHCPCSCAGR